MSVAKFRRAAALIGVTAALLSSASVATAAPADPTGTTSTTADTPGADTPAAPTTPAEAAAAAQAEVAALQAQAEQTTAALSAASQAVDEATAALAVTQAEVSAARETAAAARQAADDAQARVDAFAAAQYRNPTPAGMTLVLADTDDAEQVLQSLGYLQVVGVSQSQVVHEARGTRRAAADAERIAEAAEADARTRSAQLAADAEAAAEQAATASAQLSAGLARAEAAQRVADAFAAAGRADATGWANCVDHDQTLTLPTSTSWGGFPNGLIPADQLCPIRPGHSLRADASIAFQRLDAGFTRAFGTPLCITDSYRDYAGQVSLYGRKPTLAAVPGTSNHGWGLAVDLCGGIESAGSAQSRWMAEHAGEYGWVNPGWAQPGAGREEPWHWEFGHIS